jgi:hypothetical protein
MLSGLLRGQGLLLALQITYAKLPFVIVTGTDYLGNQRADWSHIEINLTKTAVENGPWIFVARNRAQ